MSDGRIGLTSSIFFFSVTALVSFTSHSDNWNAYPVPAFGGGWRCIMNNKDRGIKIKISFSSPEVLQLGC